MSGYFPPPPSMPLRLLRKVQETPETPESVVAAVGALNAILGRSALTPNEGELFRKLLVDVQAFREGEP